LLLYLDSGCEICNENFVKKYKILGTRTDKLNEYNCNKMDLINLFNINPEKLDMFQIQATIVFLEVSQFFKNLIKNWYELSCNYHYIDESPSIIPHPNNKIFIVHRNDQSIFSLLIKNII